ncbi:cyclodeaminase/cyclohydrolase family protein [Rhodocytophaga aerolata]|uniref:Cyclodeaminase/cyclohydrolase family protein n=1 Tax=Rhodocytophaga aerolata TaxID=455078 RepID=A0ABT8RBY8_9BACT|nr:cyclodeaminase/cyclohydrolase family protein [Rhodocytophaga aerolata]MDO1449626.1 cyclodeaminase/cyclohydrolase family protein [Rhodocytophaga aerolata]
MNIDLLELPTKELLDKIGAGNHKPGSGSAAALNGILCCKLLLTVIELTLDPKRAKIYAQCSVEFNQIKSKIKETIGPRLEELFKEDAIQFDKAIQKRIERDKVLNQQKKNQLQEEALRELKKSTELPIEIAKLCIELANYAVVVFDKGFQSARGDSGVALSSSLSGLTGCLAIISLNLQSFPKSLWTDKIKIQKNELRKEYERLTSENVKLMNILDTEADTKNEFLAEFVEIRKMFFGKRNLKDSDIEKLARRIQNALWKYQDVIWPKNPPSNELSILKPEKVIELLKYAFHKVDTLGVNDSNEEIAGIINNQDATIQISTMYAPEVVNFTTAHELGHALLHNQIKLHRDIPLDGSENLKNRSMVEREADKFAAYFLMPGKTVTQLFHIFFQTEQLQINEITSYMLANCSPLELSKRIKNQRDFSRLIAKCEFYNLKPFTSLSKIFNVSIEAMAIRLEELNLIRF